VNDLPMFSEAGLAITMGNASVDVKERANYVTSSNPEDGFAHAIARYVVGTAGGR
jgi:hydroxymethylpyrimidine pyrophosphatase-like HAD family hydrolase